MKPTRYHEIQVRELLLCGVLWVASPPRATRSTPGIGSLAERSSSTARRGLRGFGIEAKERKDLSFFWPSNAQKKTIDMFNNTLGFEGKRHQT